MLPTLSARAPQTAVPTGAGGPLPADGLKLKAQDLADLQVLSALAQDGAGKVGDIRYDPKARTLDFELNRFRWEAKTETSGGFFGWIRGLFQKPKPPERVRALLQVAEVRTVKAQGLSPKAPLQVVSLLHLSFVPSAHGLEGQETEGLPALGELRLVFAGGAELKIEVECLEVWLVDMSPSWQASSTPRHKIP